jgi:hypothetical protein
MIQIDETTKLTRSRKEKKRGGIKEGWKDGDSIY